MNYVKQQILHERKIGDRQLVITGDGNVEISPASGTVTVNGNLRVTGASSGPTNNLIYYVSLEGDDNNDGLGQGSDRAKRTVKSAVEAAPAGATIQLAPGNYYENNPITLKERQTVRGTSLRNTQIWPLNNTQDIFFVDNACYIFQITFRGLRDPGWCVRIKPGALVTTSPYVQNCTNMNGPWLNDGTEFVPFETVQIPGVVPGARPIINDTNVPLAKRVNETGGGNGMLVDGAEYDQRSLVFSMVCDSFTQIAQGGIGFHITNFGYTQIVSCFTVFCRTGFLTTNGGYLSISNSVSDFGTFGIIADGLFDTVYTTARPSQDYYSTVGSITVNSQGAGYTSAPTVTIDPPTTPGGVQAQATATIDVTTGKVTAISIDNIGSGYDFVPSVQFGGGGFTVAAIATANLSSNKVIEVNSLRDIPQVGSVISFEGDNTKYYVTNTNVTTEPFIYNETVCRRDVRRIVDAIVGDSVMGTNYQALAAGRSYLRSRAQKVLFQQLEPTIYGLEAARDEMLARIPDSDPTNEDTRYNIIEGFATVINILEQGDSTAAPDVFYNDLVTIDSGVIDAKNNIIQNRDFIVEEITRYIAEQFTDLNYDQEKCKRDVDLIIDAVARDIRLGTNHNSIVAGNAYRRATASIVDQDQFPATIIAIRYLKTLAEAAVSSSTTALTRLSDRFSVLLDILEYDASPSEGMTFSAPGTASQAEIDSARQLQENRTFLIEETIAYTNATYPSLVYNEDKCRRDAGYIVDGVTHDLLYGGNRSSLISARAYYDDGVSTLAGQEAETVDALERLRDVAADVIEGASVVKTPGNPETQVLIPGFGTSTESAQASVLFDIVIDAITGGLVTTPFNQDPDYSWINSSLSEAALNLLSASADIQQQVIDYINDNIVGFSYNIETCERDTGYIVDAAVYDLMYGGNKQTRRAAEAYYNNAVIAGQVDATEFSFKRLARVLSDVAQNILITPSSGNSLIQEDDGPNGSSVAGQYIFTITEKIAEVVRDGISVLPFEIDHNYSGLGDVTLNSKRLIILDDIDAIEDESIRLLNLEYGGVAELTLFPGLLSVEENTLGSMQNVSTVSTAGHAFEYVGAGITYNALPFFGGSPISENEFIETNNGKVFAGGTVDQVGNFKVGNFFTVNALTGAITLNANQINLSGLSSIGPFQRDGIPVGVELKEVSDSTNLISSVGSVSSDTVPTQNAVATYVENRYLNKTTGGTVNGNITVTGSLILPNVDLEVQYGGTGTSSLTGYVKGSGTSALTASTTIPNTDITGLGTISTQAANNVAITGGAISGITDLAVADGGTGASDAATARTNLGVAIGTNVQAYDAGLQSIAELNTDPDRMIYTTASDVYAVTPLTSAGRALLDDADNVAQRTTLGLGTISTQAANNVAITGGAISGITDLAVADGGTGASDAATARTNLGLGTAATTDSTAYATAAQGSTADSALQPGDAVPQTGATGSADIPAGTEAQRDVTPFAGYFRFNTDVAKFEGYNGTAWGSVGGGATGGGSDEVFIQNGQTVTTNYTIPADKNAMSTGPITINPGVTVTVSTGARYVVI